MLVQRPFLTFHICARGKESVFNLSDSSSADTYQLDNRGGNEGRGRGGEERKGEGRGREERGGEGRGREERRGEERGGEGKRGEGRGGEELEERGREWRRREVM